MTIEPSLPLPGGHLPPFPLTMRLFPILPFHTPTWGVFLIGVPVFSAASSWGFATVVSPVLTMTLLLFLSGMPTAEGVSDECNGVNRYIGTNDIIFMSVSHLCTLSKLTGSIY